MRRLENVLLLLLLPLQGVMAEEMRNPFAATASSVVAPAQVEQSASQEAVYRPPLQRYPLLNYQLLGAIVAERQQIALVQTRVGEQFMVYPGDLLGIEGGAISTITADALIIRNGEAEATLRIGRAVAAGGVQ